MIPHFHRCLLVAFAALGFCSVFIGSAASAEDAAPPNANSRGWRDPLRYRDLVLQGYAAVQRQEGVGMFLALARGAPIGPGSGWFHGSRSRYDWAWLASSYDINHDGIITPDEFLGPADLFQRLDRNQDGVLTIEDCDWSERSTRLRSGGPAAGWFRLLDTNGNGRISRAEWEEFFSKASQGKGYLTPEDLQEALRPPSAPSSGGSEMPSRYTLLNALLTGEIGSLCEGPSVGQPAPDFTLKTQDGKQEITLAHYRNKKPVVLVFGSFT
jgi:hypothetical protein